MALLNSAGLAGLVAGSLLLTSCTSLPYQPGVRPSPRADIPFFQYAEKEIRPRQRLLYRGARYAVQTLTFPSSRSTHPLNDTVQLTYYRQDRPSPVLLIFPPLAHGEIFATLTAGYFAERGLHVLQFHEKRKLLTNVPDESHPQRVLQQTIIDARQSLDWLLRQQDVQKDKVSVIGISLGALHAAIFMSADSRVHAGVFVLGGGNLPLILSTSNEPHITAYRTWLQTQLKKDGKDLKATLQKFSPPVDPLTYAHSLPADKILFIDAKYDRTIPPAASQALWERSGKPSRIILPTDHYGALFLFPYIFEKSAEHLQRALGLTFTYAPPPASHVGD